MTTKELEKKLKISNDTCIHCPTLELAKQVLSIFHQLGLKWCSETDWDSYKENTIYYPFQGGFSSLEFAHLTGFKILNAEEFIALHTEEEIKVCSKCKECRKQEYQELKNNKKEEDSQEFRIGDNVIDIILDLKGEITNVKSNGNLEIQFEGESCLIELSKIAKRPPLLHYRDDYDYDVIDFNNLPKRQEPKRWRAEKEGVYRFLEFDNEYWFLSNDTKDDYVFFDNNNYNSGNYFQTKEEAQEVADKLNKYFQELISPNK